MTAERVVNAAAIVAIAAACTIVVHKSVHFVGTAPFLHVDDSIANVAVSLAEHGRYGFLSSPTQAYTDTERTHAFFNYGPLYFWVASALTWFVGPSLVLYRMLHPLGLVCIVCALTLASRRTSLVGPAVFTVVMFGLYLDSHWPIARPDIMVSVCAALMFVAAASAIMFGRMRDWFAVGFLAASAATSHQIALAVVPASGVIWAWSVLAAPREEAGRRRAIGSFTALAAGGAAGALLFLAAVDFRVRELLTLLSGGRQMNRRPYLDALQDHFSYAWSALPPQSFRLLLALFCGAAILAVAAPALRSDRRRRALAWVMPPLVVAVLYPLSLGLNGSTHTGYVILCQVAALWTIAAGLSLATAWIAESSSAGRVVSMAVSIAAVILVARADARWLTTPSLWEQRAVGNVAMNDYVRQVLSRLPERARVWGSLYFGVNAGDRTDLLQYNQILRIVESDFRPEAFPAVAPDFLALGAYDLDQAAVLTMADGDYGFERFAKEFAPLRYRPVRIVSAPPYGSTINFEKVAEPAAALDASPEVAFNDGTGRQWTSALSAPLDVAFVPSEPVSIDAWGFNHRPRRSADASVVADLPEGAYLIEVALDRPSVARFGFVFATGGRHLYWRSGWTDFALPGTPYFPDAARVWVLADHLGGPLFLSRFEHGASGNAGERDRYAMRVTSVQRIEVHRDISGRLPALAAPPWDTWTRLDPGASLTTGTDGLVTLSGALQPNAMLLVSPPIDVPTHQRVVVTVPTEPVHGAIKVGVVALGAGSLAAATPMPRRVAFDSGSATKVVIVVQNSDLEEPVDIRLRPVTLRVAAPQEQYVDQLMQCRSFRPRDRSDCIK